MEEATKTANETSLKTKISFSVESLLATDKKNVEEDERLKSNESPNADSCRESREDEEDRYKECLDEDDDEEDITVDDDEDEIASRESLSPNSAHTVVIPQPLHPSIRMMSPQGPQPQWGFPWPGHQALMRSGSPQCK